MESASCSFSSLAKSAALGVYPITDSLIVGARRLSMLGLSDLKWGQGKLIEPGSSVGDGVGVDWLVSQQGGNVARIAAAVDMLNRSLALFRANLVVIVDKPIEMQPIRT